MRLERRAPIWSLVFIPDSSTPAPASAAGTKGQGTTIGAAPGATQGGASSGDINRDLLVVGCWDRTYSLYKYASYSSVVFNYPNNFNCRVQIERHYIEVDDGEGAQILPLQYQLLWKSYCEVQLPGK